MIKNISNITARYQMGVRQKRTSQFDVNFNFLHGDKKILAPGMQTVLTVSFKSQFPEDYFEKIVINVLHGKPIFIHVHASRDIPILEGIF